MLRLTSRSRGQVSILDRCKVSVLDISSAKGSGAAPPFPGFPIRSGSGVSAFRAAPVQDFWGRRNRALTGAFQCRSASSSSSGVSFWDRKTRCWSRWPRPLTSTTTTLALAWHLERKISGQLGCMPWKWANPVRKVRLKIEEDLGWKVTGSKLSANKDSLHCGISVKICYSSCDLYTQYQFMCEMRWMTAHLLYMWEMRHELKKKKIRLDGGNLNKKLGSFNW